jgi:hypothetical protein
MLIISLGYGQSTPQDLHTEGKADSIWNSVPFLKGGINALILHGLGMQRVAIFGH